jgi:hypothetical protein
VTRVALLVLAALLALAATPAVAFERLGVVAVADPPAGPDADLAELAHQLRAACRDRAGGVEDVPTMRARLLGRTSNATLSELDRAYGGALAVYQNGEFESALRTLHAIVEDLERLPETEDGYAQWVRAQLRLAHAALTIGREAEADAALLAVARTDPRVTADPDLYSPSYRRRFEGIKAKVRALPARRLTVTAEGRDGTVYVNGRPMGTTPLTLRLPGGTYRIGGAAEGLRVPGFELDLQAEDRSAVLDFALAGSLRVNAGPGLALPAARRGDGIVRAGAWLGVDRVVAVSRADEGDAAFLLGSIYDVRRGALLREGSVRMVAGSVPAANLGALAAFLLTGQSSRDVLDRTELVRERVLPAEGPESAPAPATDAAPPASGRGAPLASAPRASAPRAQPRRAPPAEIDPPSLAAIPAAHERERALAPRPRWLRRAALAAGLAAGGCAALAVQQGLAARGAYADADAMVAGDVFVPGSDPARYRELRGEGDAARRNAYLSAGVAAAFGAAAGVLGWRSVERPAAPVLAVRF